MIVNIYHTIMTAVEIPTDRGRA